MIILSLFLSGYGSCKQSTVYWNFLTIFCGFCDNCNLHLNLKFISHRVVFFVHLNSLHSFNFIYILLGLEFHDSVKFFPKFWIDRSYELNLCIFVVLVLELVWKSARYIKRLWQNLFWPTPSKPRA